MFLSGWTVIKFMFKCGLISHCIVNLTPDNYSNLVRQFLPQVVNPAADSVARQPWGRLNNVR